MLKTFMKEEKKLLKGLKIEYFHFIVMKFMNKWKHQQQQQKKKKKKKERKNQKNKKKQDRKPFDPDEVIEWMIKKEKAPINNELFEKHFKVQKLIVMYKVLYETNGKEKNSKLVNIFHSGLEDLEKEIKEMSEEEREIEKPCNIVKVVKKILEINKYNQQGKGLKLLTPN